MQAGTFEVFLEGLHHHQYRCYWP